MAPVIVFGPTGNIGSITALTASEQGATVILAMRDTKKPIPGLSASKEASGNFKRVQADLTDPTSVATAVTSTGAKRAYLYLAHGSPDHMRSTLEALKSAGIEFVVFLSSFTIGGDPAAVTPDNLISFIHAQVELGLAAVFGLGNFVAMRPGAFATNILRYKSGIQAGQLPLFGADFEHDCITPHDMGRVGGTLLVSGPKNGEQVVYLYGPKFLAMGECSTIVAKVLGHDLQITLQAPEDAVAYFTQLTGRKHLAEFLVDSMAKGNDRDAFVNNKEGVANVEKYTGTPSLGFEEWVKANLELWSS